MEKHLPVGILSTTINNCFITNFDYSSCWLFRADGCYHKLKEVSIMKMKKIFTHFTFYFTLASLLTIVSHITGGDPHGIILFQINPILSAIRYTDFANNVLSTGPIIVSESLAGEISIFWYIIHFISFTIVGVILDVIKHLIKKYISYRNTK